MEASEAMQVQASTILRKQTTLSERVEQMEREIQSNNEAYLEKLIEMDNIVDELKSERDNLKKIIEDQCVSYTQREDNLKEIIENHQQKEADLADKLHMRNLEKETTTRQLIIKDKIELILRQAYNDPTISEGLLRLVCSMSDRTAGVIGTCPITGYRVDWNIGPDPAYDNHHPNYGKSEIVEVLNKKPEDEDWDDIPF